jgi:hypothetical protein
MVVAGSFWGAKTAGLAGVAWAVSFAIVFMWVLIIHQANAAAGLSWKSFATEIGPVLAVNVGAGLVASAAVYAVRYLVKVDIVVLLFGAVLFGFLSIWSLVGQVDRSKYNHDSKLIRHLRKLDVISRIVRSRFGETNT